MPDSAQPLAGHRILVVEDEYLIAMDLKRWLTAAGAIVVGPVPSIERAFGVIQTGDLTVAVLDVNLGDGETAYPIADELEKRGIPFLFATGDVTLSAAGLHRRRPQLTKPYLAMELVKAVVELLSRPSPTS